MGRTPTPNYNIGMWLDHEHPLAGPQDQDSLNINGNWWKIDIQMKANADAILNKTHSTLVQDEIAKHRIINDGAASPTELWSANKINAEISAIQTSYNRRKKVINIVDCTAAPPTEVTGDRYILDDTVGTVHANWDGAAKLDIVEFNGTVWIASTPDEGWVTYVDDQNKDALYVDDGTPEWEVRNIAVTNHSQLVDDEPQKHRLINDSGAGATDLWSADKITTKFLQIYKWPVNNQTEMQNALTNAIPGDAIDIRSNFAASSGLILPNSTNDLTINGHNKVLTRPANDHLFKMTSSGQVTGWAINGLICDALGKTGNYQFLYLPDTGKQFQGATIINNIFRNNSYHCFNGVWSGTMFVVNKFFDIDGIPFYNMNCGDTYFQGNVYRHGYVAASNAHGFIKTLTFTNSFIEGNIFTDYSEADKVEHVFQIGGSSVITCKITDNLCFVNAHEIRGYMVYVTLVLKNHIYIKNNDGTQCGLNKETGYGPTGGPATGPLLTTISGTDQHIIVDHNYTSPNAGF